jgi:hypothetical protein
MNLEFPHPNTMLDTAMKHSIESTDTPIDPVTEPVMAYEVCRVIAAAQAEWLRRRMVPHIAGTYTRDAEVFFIVGRVLESLNSTET